MRNDRARAADVIYNEENDGARSSDDVVALVIIPEKPIAYTDMRTQE